uniref:Uncharacterized protein n=1 Tax=Glossina palpalis gambiensis TaxID=67801 RepID=A0A1B0BB08_9MUSC
MTNARHGSKIRSTNTPPPTALKLQPKTTAAENSLPTLITTDSFLVDTSIEVHNHPFVAVDYDDAFADALRDEVVAVSFAVVYGRSNAAFDPKALALADLDPLADFFEILDP